MYTILKLSLKTAFSRRNITIPIQANKMLHFSPNYHFFHSTENASKPRHHAGSHAQPKNMQCYTGCNIFRHPHQQNASGETTEKKHGIHVTFRCHTWILHVTVTLM